MKKANDFYREVKINFIFLCESRRQKKYFNKEKKKKLKRHAHKCQSLLFKNLQVNTLDWSRSIGSVPFEKFHKFLIGHVFESKQNNDSGLDNL